MAKLTLADITAGYGGVTTYNANNALIEAALENTLSRDGTSPNTMSANLDMNSNNIVNLADGVNAQDAVTKAQLDAVEAGTGDVGITGTPVDNQVAIWTSASTIEGQTDLTFVGNYLTIAGVAGVGGLALDSSDTGNSVKLISFSDGSNSSIGIEFEQGKDSKLQLYNGWTDPGGFTQVEIYAKDLTVLTGAQPTSADGYHSQLLWVNADYYSIGEIGFDTASNSNLYITNLVNSAEVIIKATNASAGEVEVGKFKFDQVALGNYLFDTDQTVGAGQDNYVLTYDDGTGFISLEAAAGGGGDVTKVGTPVDNQIGVWTGDGTIEGDANFTWDGSQLLLPGTGGAAAPTIGFGDANSGFYELSDNTLGVSLNGVGQFYWQPTTNIFTGNGSSSFYCRNISSSRTVPTIGPRRDTDTGIGQGAADELSLIAGGEEFIRLYEFGSSDNIQFKKPVDMEGNRIKDYALESDSQVVSANAFTITYSDGPTFQVDLEAATAAVTGTISGGPTSGTYGQITVKVEQDSTTAQTLTWAGGTMRWAGGSAHPVTTTVGGFTIYTFETWDAGATWYGSGADYA
jgi:hypothetical protein